MREKRTEVVLQKKHLVMAALVIAVLFVGGILLALRLGREQVYRPADGEIDSGASVWSGMPLEDKSEEPQQVGIKIPGYPAISLPANQKTVRLALLNPEGNPCYFTFQLVLRDIERNTEEILYTSKLVPPGQAVTELTLSRALSAGTYDAVIKISTTSLENGSPMNGANVETVLTVK